MTQSMLQRFALDFDLRIANSRHTSAFSRRNASEVCQSLANRARGWSGGRRQGACEAPLEAGQWTHLARQGTARAQGKAQRLPALHRPPGHRPSRDAPVRPAFALSAERSLLESSLSLNRTE